MPRIATRHAHKLAYRRRLSLGLRMLGCLILLAGSIVLAAALAELAKGSLSRPAWLMIGFGLLLFACGAALFCGEHGKLFDRESRTLRCWWGVIVPLRRTVYDLQPYQAVSVQPCPQEVSDRWRVCLWNVHGERLELFDLAGEEVAQLAARQVAGFLSLPIAPPSGEAIAAASAPAVGDASVSPQLAVSPQAGNRWIHREHFGKVLRTLGVILVSFGLFLLAGLLSAADAEGRRWPQAVAVASPLWLLGLWLIFGGRKVEVDMVEQTVMVWRAWPLPPAVYELAQFYAVVVAPSSDEIQEKAVDCLVGLVDPDQLRLELLRALPRDAARSAATQLATTARLPLIDESQPSLTRPPVATA